MWWSFVSLCQRAIRLHNARPKNFPMNQNETIHARAASSDCLTQRIAENSAGQQTDLVEWIFERVPIPENADILELCCGTGAQTIRLAETRGSVTAIDVSGKALETMLARLSPDQRERVKGVEASLDAVSEALPASAFDLIFCAYGLYYSSDPVRTLDTVRQWLRPGGEIVVVGPFGPNNGALFEILERCGVAIPAYVKYTSQDFMTAAVLPWAGCHFETTQMHTLMNPVLWDSAEKILNYWQNSTFYAEDLRAAVEQALADFFRREKTFVNEKWIMLARMTDARR